MQDSDNKSNQSGKGNAWAPSGSSSAASRYSRTEPSKATSDGGSSRKVPDATKKPVKALDKTKLGGKLKDAIPEQVEEESIGEEYSDVEFEEEEKADTIKKREEDKKHIREYEKKKQAGKLQFAVHEDPDDNASANVSSESKELDENWMKLRDFFDDVDVEGNKIVLRRGMKPTRIRFLEYCEQQSQLNKRQPHVLSFDKILRGFKAAYMQPEPTEAPFKKLFRGLEVFHDESTMMVDWRKLLEANTTREINSIRGIFPKILPKPPSTAQLEKQKREEEDAKAAKEKLLQDIETRRAETEKSLMAQRRIADNSKNRSAMDRGAASTKMTAGDARTKEKEEALKREEERKIEEIRKSEELQKVKKEVSEFNKRLNHAMNRFVEAGPKEEIFNAIRVYDSNGDNFLTLSQLTQALTRKGIRLNPDEIVFLNEFLEPENVGQGLPINYKELVQMIYGSKKVNAEKIISERRKNEGRDTGITDSIIEANRLASKATTFKGASEKHHPSVSGMTELMQRSDMMSEREVPQLINDDDYSNNFMEIKETFMDKCFTFEDLLAKMGRPKPGAEHKVVFDDFQNAVLATCGNNSFSKPQIRFVFRENARAGNEKMLDPAYIPIRDFKDRFYPGRPWRPELIEEERRKLFLEQQREDDGDSSKVQTSFESMLIDPILAGRRQQDLQEEQIAEAKAERMKVLMEKKGQTASIKDEYEGNSEASLRIDAILRVKQSDPKQMKAGQAVHVTNTTTLSVNSQTNPDFYRQKDYVYQRDRGTMKYDPAIDYLIKDFIQALKKELRTVSGATRNPESFVDQYGKELPGYITYNEFTEIYKAHYHYIDDEISGGIIAKADNKDKHEAPDPNKIRALFQAFNSEQKHKISREEFGIFVRQESPLGSFIEKLQKKVQKGQMRLIKSLHSECQDADIDFGSTGLIPLSVFQTIMFDYDLPMVESDKVDFKERSFLILDKDKNELIDYIELLKCCEPKRATVAGTSELAWGAVVIQKCWRMYAAKMLSRKMRATNYKAIGDKIKDFKGAHLDPHDKTLGKRGGRSSSPSKTAGPRKRLTREQQLEKKKETMRQQRLAKNATLTLDKKMDAQVKGSRDPRALERERKSKRDMEAWIKDTLIEQMVTAAQCYGESLQVCNEIQSNFENRPVTKFVYPLVLQFQFQVAGVQPKSLQSMNALGQVMFLNSSNQLNQYDIGTTKALQQVNLGTRPPLKHYDIIDMVVDQRSGRIYTLNSNWILEIWNIEQNASFPQKRIAVCTNEGGKDFISLYYRQTYYKAKPRFLCLQESNQQILVVNTSCVDGSIVFIDPISFSVLKKIQLRYQDYELPQKVRDAITRLKQVFGDIKRRQGKDIGQIFMGIIDRNTEEVKIASLVQELKEIDPELSVELLFHTCRALDVDSSGSISLDEFLQYFGSVEDDSSDQFKRAQDEQLLQDEIWPQWVIQEGKMPLIQTLLAQMFSHLTSTFNIQAEDAFGLFDNFNRGDITVANFKKVLAIYFQDVISEEEGHYELILKLSGITPDQKVNYRQICKLLSKRVIRTFKHVMSGGANSALFADDAASKQKSPIENELDRPLLKTSSLSYILRKCAELDIDLRREFVKNDSLELSVIPRVKFWGIVMDLPLGLNESDLAEIMDNDLSFDNYGNVDYTLILNSDIFVTLERRRLRARAVAAKVTGSQLINNGEDLPQVGGIEDNSNDALAITDNRKVVVEDLIFIDDLEVIIYTTVQPKTSTVFITNLSKVKPQQSGNQASMATKVIELAQLGDYTIDDLKNMKEKAERNEENAGHGEQNNEQMLTNHYKLIAKLKGHKNHDPPSICYVPSSGCLITGEKYLTGDPYAEPSKASTADNPDFAPTFQAQNSKEGHYEQYSKRTNDHSQKCEVLVWNLQRDMIELFSVNPPWSIPYHTRFTAHDASIVDICFLSNAQLIVTSSVDQTIKFWDPVNSSYELTDPKNNPHAKMRPGNYKSLLKEQTKTNQTFREVKRIYTGSDSACFALRGLIIPNIVLNDQMPEVKSQIEWLVCLKLNKPNVVFAEAAKHSQMGFICGYGIERVKLEVPAKHHDDIVPPYIIKECEDLIQQRRQKLVTAFQRVLPITIEKMYSQVMLQNSYMDKIRQLFMKAILSRKDEKYVNPVPLREIYQIIVKLPNRTKFESFLASSGCSDKLSVSETFFYLQKFTQIHPLRTTQIEFEKSIEDFYQRHQRQFLRGVKRWPKEAVQKFANYIRIFGLDIAFLQEPAEATFDSRKAKVLMTFCTRERFMDYFIKIVQGKQQEMKFSDVEIDQVMNELDPYHTGAIQISLVQRYYCEEIRYHRMANLQRPRELLQQIRSVAFPAKKIALQQSLASADEQGDGFITKDQLVQAFYRVPVNINRENLEFLFDVMAERYNTPADPNEFNAESMVKGTVEEEEDKFLNLQYFNNRLFEKNETVEICEIDSTLQSIKATMIYKNIDFSVIFAEVVDEPEQQKPGQRVKKSKARNATKFDNQLVDIMSHQVRFAQQLVKDEFENRVNQLNAQYVTPDKVIRLANFLALNQKNQSVVNLNSWLHHLRRVQTAFHISDRRNLPVICSKLLQNETFFRNNVENIGMLKNKREEDKNIALADLRQVLIKYSVNHIDQDMFLQHFSNGYPVNLEDLIASMKHCYKSYYKQATAQLNVESTSLGLKEDMAKKALEVIKTTDYFGKIKKKLKKHADEIDCKALQDKFEEFDPLETGSIKAFKLVKVLQHNLGHFLKEDLLVGLQHELQCLAYDQTVDISEFIKLFFDEEELQGKKDKIVKNSYSLQDFEDLLSKIRMHLKQSQDFIDLKEVFGTFTKESGFITYKQLHSILELISYPVSESEFELIKMYADENNTETIHAWDLCDQIIHAEEISTYFDIVKWKYQIQYLQGRVHILELVLEHLALLREQIDKQFGDEDTGVYNSGVLTASQFQDLIKANIPQMQNRDIHLLTVFCVRGSLRTPKDQHDANQMAGDVDIDRDLIQFHHMEKALLEIINVMKKEEIDTLQKKQEEELFSGDHARMQREKNYQENLMRSVEANVVDHAQFKRESALISKITSIFREREITFFEAFEETYDPLSDRNIVSIKKFKDMVATLNLPLTVQDHRILRRIADPKSIGKVDLRKFCPRFETLDLRNLRLNRTLDKVATAFFTQNFNLKKAFLMFDLDGNGYISLREFRHGLNSLDLGLTYDEIDDLMRLMSTGNDGQISYDDFIQQMDANIRHRRGALRETVEDAIFKQISNCLLHSGEELYDVLKVYDFDDNNTINREDFIRVFKRLNVSNFEAHLPIVLQIGGCGLQDEKIDIWTFSHRIMREVKKRDRKNNSSTHAFIRQLHSILKIKSMSLFDFFFRLDVNQNGSLSQIEFKTGIQCLGLNPTRDEFAALWKHMYRKKKSIKSVKDKARQDTFGTGGSLNTKNRPKIQMVTFLDLIHAFVSAGCIKFAKATDRSNTLIQKFRQQLKRLGLSVDKLYKLYDPHDHRFVFRSDFIETSIVYGFEFSEEEYEKIFEIICGSGSKSEPAATDQQSQALVKPQKSSKTRFTQKQLVDTILKKRDDNWINQAYIKINSVVIQKSTTYKRLFNQWKDKAARIGGAFRLNEKELMVGLKRLKAGLTQDEIEQLVGSLHFDGKDNAIDASTFQEIVNRGAAKLESEQSFERMILTDWIMQFNEQIERHQYPFERLFEEYDSGHKGALSFEDFANLNEYVGVSLSKKDLRRIFDAVDRNKNSSLRLEEIRNVSALTVAVDEEDLKHQVDSELNEIPDEELTGEQLMLKQQVNDIYEEIKNKVETKNTTMEHIMLNEMKFQANALATSKGLRDSFTKLGVANISVHEGNYILQQVRRANFGKFHCTYSDVINFLTRKRVNVAFLEKGFVDPLLAASVSQINQLKDEYDLTHYQLFKILAADEQEEKTSNQSAFRSGGAKPASVNDNMFLTKDKFVVLLQGMDLKVSVEDINELFNYIDDKLQNKINAQKFVDAMTFISSKMGGPSIADQFLLKGTNSLKKGVVNYQLISAILKQIADGIQKQHLSIRQLMRVIDINKTGYVSRAEFVPLVRNLNDQVTLQHTRTLMNFLESNGKISVYEFTRLCMEILNQQIGGGQYAFMQVQPIIQKIINELSIDCDRFFDDVAEKNDEYLEDQRKKHAGLRDRQKLDAMIKDKDSKNDKSQVAQENATIAEQQMAAIGLSKSIFFERLIKYGVQLKEYEKALISTVFGMKGKDRDKLDYEKIDNTFEGIQQQLYSQESQYTKEWERGVFKKMGRYLRKNNVTIQECFEMVDTDDSQTVSVDELRSCLIRMELGISESQMKMFLKRLTDEGKRSYMTQDEFLKHFWSAYTYEEVFDEEEKKTFQKAKGQFSSIQMPKFGQESSRDINMLASHNIREASKKIKSELELEVKKIQMFRSIQKRVRETKTIQDAFNRLDSQRIGYLTLVDFQTNFYELFGLTMEENDVRLLFQEIDSDENGIIKYTEFEQFYNEDYIARTIALEKDKENKNTQNEIFDHLIKVLLQRNLTLQDVFEQIDADKNNYIEVSEFHDVLERMGFTITEGQVLELMRSMDENFDGRISYNELRAHIMKLGFEIQKIEERGDHPSFRATGRKAMMKKNEKNDKMAFKWRDKALELMIRTFKNGEKTSKMSYQEYFKTYDRDHDGHLTPAQFRKACLDLNESQLRHQQIERILHILIEEKKMKPLVNIDRVAKLLLNYKYIDLNDGKGSQSVLIDEDLFVYIVEKYDGLSRMIEQAQNIEDRSCYLSRHTYEINLRGLHCLSNQKTIQRLCGKSNALNELYDSTMVLLAGEVNRLIKEEAQMCVLDPSTNINTIVSDQNIGVLTSVSIPTIENSQFDIDFATQSGLPCGALRYQGTKFSTKESVEVMMYPSEVLQYVSLDGKVFKRHLALELQVHRYLMGARYEEDENLDMLDEESMDIFANLGKFEKKIGLSVAEKEVYVVNRLVDDDEWICLDDFVHQNGGILNIPLFYHTDASLFIIRHWAKMILQIIAKVHDVSVVLRCLSTKQLFISRDGQRIRLGHTRGIGKVNNLGFIVSCPDIYLNLENNEATTDRFTSTKHSSNISPGKTTGAKTDGQRNFSNQALDSAFVAPEMLFSKFQDHTAAIDVWAFGMIMFCVLFGKKPDSFYKTYRQWYKKSHNHDVEMGDLPFLPPSKSNFLYDPFSIDFENPFENVDYEEMLVNKMKGTHKADDLQKQNFDFGNFMKCIKDLSYSAMFTDENSKKYNFNSVSDEIKNSEVDQNNAAGMERNYPPTFSGQETSQKNIRQSTYKALAKQMVLSRKNELGLILDLVASCIDVDPKKRPTIKGLLHSPIFSLDNYERTNAVRFSQNVILYRSPQSTVSMRITDPLRKICADAIKNPMSLYDREDHILKLFSYTEDCIGHVTSIPLEDINQVLTENEKSKGLARSAVNNHFSNKDFSQLRVSPNSPLACQIVDDKVIDMLLFVTFRYLKHFQTWKKKRLAEIEMYAASLSTENRSTKSKSVRFGDDDNEGDISTGPHISSGRELLKNQTKRLQNRVLSRMTHLLKTMVYEMHNYSTPMAPFAFEVVTYIVKFFLGEEHSFGSDVVLKKTSKEENSLKDFLNQRSFFRREAELDETFKSDQADKLWHLEQKNMLFLDKSNYWCTELHKEALKIFKDAITESGMGNSCYPVINDYIQNVSNSFEPSKVFSKQMNALSLSFLIPTYRTSAYFNELIPITESLSRLYDPNLEKAGKRCSLAMIRSVFQTGNSDKIKACLDLRVPKHIIHFLQDTDADIRKECLLTFFEISKGLQDDDFEIIGKHAVNMKQEFDKQSYRKSAFEQHKAVSMASQQEILDASSSIPNLGSGAKRGRVSKQDKKNQAQSNNADDMTNFMKRTIALIEKNENEKYINFALDLPNLNFLACKRFLREMAICFESPVFIAPLIRLLKTPTEKHENKMIILDLMKNLVSGSEKVLVAVNSPASDTYMTLLKILIKNNKMDKARSALQGNSGGGQMTTSMLNPIILQTKCIDLFKFMFEQRRPTIIRDLSCIGASSTLLKEQELEIPQFITLPDIMYFFDEISDQSELTAERIDIKTITAYIKDLRCWVKHFYATSNIPELTRIKALQRAMNLLVRVFKLVWDDYFCSIEELKPTHERKHQYMSLMRHILALIDWLCINDKEIFLFNEECGRTNLNFVIQICNKVLSQFRRPLDEGMPLAPIEETAFNKRENKKVQNKRRYDIFPFTDVGATLQNILYQLVRKNDQFINQLLSEANFGFIFGEQLLLEYDFIRHCIDNEVESLVLMDSYVKKNEIRLNTFEFLLRSHEHTLKEQFIKSNFIERLFMDNIKDFREFNIQFSKIELEFLAFRRSYPLRLESIALLNTSLMLKQNAPQIYTEMIMYARRHFLVRQERNLLQRGSMGFKESTTMLLFAVILEANEQDLMYVMVQEGVHRVIRDLMKEYPSLNKRFPILAVFINKF